MEHVIQIENEYELLPEGVNLDEIEFLFKKLIDKELPFCFTETYLFLVRDPLIKKINCQRRKKDVSTDVLSFPYVENRKFDLPFIILGEIVISIDKVKEQAIFVGHSTREEFFRLLVHGFLHLLGYDHQESKEKIIMEQKENECLNFILG